jgi:hypothetical protein
MRTERCERCPDEDTNKCLTCNPDKSNEDRQQESQEISTGRAKEFFEEANGQYTNISGDMAKQIEEYKVNVIAIEVLKHYEAFLAAGVKGGD